MLRRLVVTVSCVLLVGVVVQANDRAAGEHRRLTFTDRVVAQRKIARIYYSHQLDTRKPFDDAISYHDIEAEVRRYLKKSAALERIWQTPVTPEMLERELSRIARATRSPERLRELYAALGNDPLLIAECIARPALVERLVDVFFSRDVRIHEKTKAEAEALYSEIERSGADRFRGEPRRTVLHVTSGASEPGTLSETRRRVSDSEFQRLGASSKVGRPVLSEERGAFVVTTLRSASADELQFAVDVVAKESWDTWWQAVEPTLELEPAQTPAAQDVKRLAALLSDVRPATNSDPGAGSDACHSGDFWVSGEFDDAPDPRSYHSAVWTGTQMIVWGGYAGTATTASIPLNTGASYDPLIDVWHPISSVNAPIPRVAHAAVWANGQMIIWGGNIATLTTSGVTNSGGRYDPATDTWAPTSMINAPVAREAPAAVWTGTNMVVWGGKGGDLRPLASGARYDPSADQWLPMSSSGATPARYSQKAVWTGQEMIVWGGPTTGGPYGARYNPVSDVWSSMADTPVLARSDFSIVWTGQEMIVWGGATSTGFLATGARYNPATDSWKVTPALGAPTPRGLHTALWTGQEMLVWGGYPSQNTLVSCAFDPATDTWRTLPASPTLLPRRSHTAIWTGSRMVVWGGGNDSVAEFNSGGQYDPIGNSWTPTSTGSGPTPRSGHSTIWTGSHAIVWGGGALNDGARYDPTLDLWTPTSRLNAPSARFGHSGVWTGSRMLVWGGGGYPYVNTGGRYDPTTDTWESMSTVDAPSPREEQTAVWTGQEMIIWGGYPFVNTGGRYDPVRDVWRPTSTINAPSGRMYHTGVWTGSRMIVWGGRGQPNTGGRYDPVTDTWEPTSTVNAPEAREDHTAVWTGRYMVVWGGGFSSESTPAGGRYDPATDTWLATSLVGAPSARRYHTAVWTGQFIVTWGGRDNSGNLPNTGGQYDPDLDSWRPMSTQDAPVGRYHVDGVWTDREFFIWGGGSGFGTLSSGGRYRPCSANQAPIAAIDVDPTVECGGRESTVVALDASHSSDADDDALTCAWSSSDCSIVAPNACVTSASCSLGEHSVSLVVHDGSLDSAPQHATVTVADTTPPRGSVTSPDHGACFGPTALPVQVADGFQDVCSATVVRTYDPPGGSYSSHGDWSVAVTATDANDNASTSGVAFTIDLLAPTVAVTSPGDGQPLPSANPFRVLFTSSDEDAATGGIVHETLSVSGCLLFDGATFGDRDGLLSDETIVIGSLDFCRMAARCGASVLANPEIAVEATDCGGNVASSVSRLRGTLTVLPGDCSRRPARPIDEAAAELRHTSR